MLSLDIDVKINNSIAKVTLTQVYQNTRNNAIDTEYLFPVNDLGVFDSFQAIYKDKTVNGVIKKKDQAKKEFKLGVE